MKHNAGWEGNGVVVVEGPGAPAGGGHGAAVVASGKAVLLVREQVVAPLPQRARPAQLGLRFVWS